MFGETANAMTKIGHFSVEFHFIYLEAASDQPSAEILKIQIDLIGIRESTIY